MRWQPSEIMRLPYSRRCKLREEIIEVEEAQNQRLRSTRGGKSVFTNPLPKRSVTDSDQLRGVGGDNSSTAPQREYHIQPPSTPPPRRVAAHNPRRPKRSS